MQIKNYNRSVYCAFNYNYNFEEPFSSTIIAHFSLQEKLRF